ncbi:MAG: hypothetical protein QHJ73_15625, partial [Armatimonadota bacterium]|nr:hypothetical protein [Armatimonadota bacterium]
GSVCTALPGWISGLLLVLANPVVWGFWIATVAAAGPRRVPFALGFVVGITAADVLLAVAGSRGGRWLGPRGQARVLRLSALLLWSFCAWGFFRAWRG